MKTVYLIDLFKKPMSGEWGKEPEEGDETVGVIRTTNFSDDIRIDKNSEIVRRVIRKDKVEKKKLISGDIIIEKSGGSPNQPVGRILYYELNSKINLCNNFTAILRPRLGNDSKYLAYLLYWLYNRKEVLKYQNKTTGIINLKLNMYLKSTEVNIPSLTTQNKTVEVLDKAQELIDLRKKQIELLDELIQSIFYDMFGDPVVNTKGWKNEEFGNHIKILTDYHANGSYKILKQNVELLDNDDYALMIRTTDLENNNFEEGVKYINRHAYDFLKKTKVYGGEIIVNKIGSAGKVYLMPFLNRPVSLGMNQFMIRTDNYLNNNYIYYLFNSNEGSKLIMSKARGAVTKTITKKAIRGINIPIPPIELQNEFAQKVQKIEEQKELMQESLSQMEDNFNALMQKAFKGEPFN